MFSKQVARAFALRNGLSQAEIDRAERVDRNNSFLMDLDLIDYDEAEHEVFSARSNRIKGENLPVYIPLHLGARG